MRVLFVAAMLAASATGSAIAQQFGGVISSTDSEIIVGETGNRAFPGIVYIYEKGPDNNWMESAKLTADTDKGPDYFGQAIAVNGSTMLVGASAGTAQTVYIYKKGEDGWISSGMIKPDDLGDSDAFGSSIHSHHKMVTVAATGQNEGAGAVYVFKLEDDGSVSQTGKLAASDAEAGDSFGNSIAYTNHTLLISAPGKANGTGTVYTFKHDMDSGEWVEGSKLDGFGLEEGHRYGSSISVVGTDVFVGAPRYGMREGAVFTFTADDSGSLSLSGKLNPFDASRNAQFGASIVQSGESIWIGAPGANGSTGAVYSFSKDADGNWASSSKWAASDLTGRAGFGGNIAVNGDVAAVSVTGMDSGEGGVKVFEKTDGMWNEVATLINDVKGFASIVDGQMNCSESVASHFECSDVDLVSMLSVKDLGGSRGIGVNDIWGWTDPQTSREYALVGRTDGTSFVDVTVATNPIFVGDLPKTPGSRTSVWRDIKVYKDHAYIVADGAAEHGMQVFDLTKLRDVENAPVTFEPTAHYDQIASAHNIVINEETGFAYSVGSSSGGTTCGGGLHMIDIRDPKNPTFAGCFADINTGRRGTGYSHDAQCVTYNGPDTEHKGKEICVGSNETMLSIADVSDKENPIALSATSYPNVAYAHQGWLTEDHAYFYMNDEGDEPRNLVEGTRTLVWDVSDLDDPILVKEYIATTTTTDHNLYIRGTTMYQSNYGSGLRILDITNPEDPTEIGFFDTTPYEGAAGSWSNYPYFDSGIIIVTSMKEGLFVLKKKDVEL
ncbi:MAG: choice-of-anchor B family protein [Rhodothermales bacterium]|nr:choice-of-anchor B family protein [Rhodothermales bacterium]